ncbi:hypothetical protein ACTMS0_23395 [Micromonospora sp. H33]|uniref:hypothetical protein n=1 Tax=Micromonospora sp. H33 TaxID=3452215 RepID=UPI003F8B47C3
MTERDHDLGLLWLLDREPSTRSTVDVGRAMAEGRRRRRLRRAFTYVGAGGMSVVVVAGGTLAVAALRTDQPDRSASAPTTAPSASASAEPTPSASDRPTAAPSVAAAPPPPTRCAISKLPVPDGVTMALVTGADPTGRILLGRSYPRDGDHQVLVWTAGKATKVPMRGSDQTLHDVTTAGLAVGAAHQRLGAGDEGFGPVPYAYAEGRLTRLRGVTFGSARAVNEAGKIVGVDDRSRRPVVWASPASEAVPLPLPRGADGGEAHDVDEDGTVVGTVITDGARTERPYVWFPDGSHRELPLPNVQGVTGARAFTVRNGWATGVLVGTRGGAAASAVRWNVRTGEVRVFPEFAIRASTANAHGWQVGTDPQGRGLFLSEAGPVTLPDLVKHEPGALTNIGETVSDDGRTIGGQADDASGTIRAVVWRCT